MQTPCVFLTRDDELARRVTGQLHSCAQIIHVASGRAALAECRKHDPLLLILEIGWHEALDTCRTVRRKFPDTLIIALGAMRSDPMREAADLGVYACHSAETDRLHLQDLVRNAFAHLTLVEENRILHEQSHTAPETRLTPELTSQPPSAKPLGLLTQVFRHAQDVDGMLGGVVETAATAIGVSRAGIFAQPKPDAEFVLRAGLRCLSETESLVVRPDDDFAEWLNEHAHVAARMTLSHIEPSATRIMIKRWLDTLGAEVIVPLHGHNRLIGWFFTGRLASGIPFDHESLNHLIAVAHDVGVVLENGLLTEEATVQRTLAETVLGSIPAGIIAVDTSGQIQWFNDSAGHMLGLTPAEAIGQPTTCLGARLVDMLIRATKGDIAQDPITWIDPITHLPLSVITRTLRSGDTMFGAVAILHDLSRERLLRDKQERIDRATFWTELAAAISHEVRNPLVAISTFAQLLPERHEDPEFRQEFSRLAVDEIDRLNGMIDQINDFANPPELCFQNIDLNESITEGVKQAKAHLNSGIPVRVTIDPSLPPVRGDMAALTNAFRHIVCNAIEALSETADPSILILAVGGDSTVTEQVTIHIQDNGPGIPPAIVDKVFSPFCTMKSRGIGLGLPIVKRTITDHNGHIDIETGTTGTTVAISLPTAASDQSETPSYEATHSSHR